MSVRPSKRASGLAQLGAAKFEADTIRNFMSVTTEESRASAQSSDDESDDEDDCTVPAFPTELNTDTTLQSIFSSPESPCLSTYSDDDNAYKEFSKTIDSYVRQNLMAPGESQDGELLGNVKNMYVRTNAVVSPSSKNSSTICTPSEVTTHLPLTTETDESSCCTCAGVPAGIWNGAACKCENGQEAACEHSHTSNHDSVSLGCTDLPTEIPELHQTSCLDLTSVHSAIPDKSPSYQLDVQLSNLNEELCIPTLCGSCSSYPLNFYCLPSNVFQASHNSAGSRSRSYYQKNNNAIQSDQCICTSTQASSGISDTLCKSCDQKLEPDVVTLDVGTRSSHETYKSTHPEQLLSRSQPAEFHQQSCSSNAPASNHTTAKLLKDSGQAYVTSKGNFHEARSMGKGCDKKCKRNCHKVVHEVLREAIFKSYWALGSPVLQWSYIAQHVKTQSVKRRTKTIFKEVHKRNFSNTYYLSTNVTTSYQVCQTMFLATLGVSAKCVRTALKKRKDNTGTVIPDRRGKVPRQSSGGQKATKSVQ